MPALLIKLKTQNSKLKTAFIAFFFTFTFLLLTLSSPVSAQTATSSATNSALPLQIPSSTFQVPSTVNPTSPLYTDLLVHNLFHTASCLMAGFSIIGQPCLTYKITQDAQGAIKSVPVLSQANLSGGLLGAEASIIDLMYLNRPVKTADYLATIGEDLGIKEAHAQVGGSGAQVLSPIIRLWQVSRNVAYLLMILVFVIIGLMVMFRQRINPQTVVTAQAAIPGLVIGLILITFSFFLAGLLSDMAFIGTNLVGFYFSAAQEGGGLKTNLVGELSDRNVLGLFSQFINAITTTDLASAFKTVFDATGTNVQIFFRVFAGLIAFNLGTSIGGLFPIFTETVKLIAGGLAAFGVQADITGIMGLVLWFTVTVILIYTMLRLLLRLITNFLSIIFLTISAPFHFLAASLPGRQDIATAWILNMLCNVLAFPAVAAVFYFVAFLLKGTYPPFTTTAPTPITGTTAFPLFGGMDLNFINILLAFGALVASPSVPDIICRTIGRVGIAGQLIGQELTANLRGQRYWDEVGERAGQGAGQFGRTFGAIRGQRALEWNADAYGPGRGGWVAAAKPGTTFAQPGEIARGRAELQPRKP